MNIKKISIWVIAVLITVGTAIYQRHTGPTYPKTVNTEINETEYRLSFIRSFGGDQDAEIILPIEDENVTGKLHYKYYPPQEDDVWQTAEFEKTQEGLIAKLPNQPPAGKLMYKVSLEDNQNIIQIFEEEPVIIRFKGDVPAWAIILHVIFIFAAMLISNTAGIFAAFKVPKFKLHTVLAFWLFIVGGMILGPIVQKYAFNEFWAGIPFGWDLTDNKTLIATIIWLIAYAGNMKKARPALTIVAAVATLIIFLIPHSMMGSELDRTTGEITYALIHILKF